MITLFGVFAILSLDILVADCFFVCVILFGVVQVCMLLFELVTIAGEKWR